MKKLISTILILVFLAQFLSGCLFESGEDYIKSPQTDQMTIADAVYGSYIIYVYPDRFEPDSSENKITAAALTLSENGNFRVELLSEYPNLANFLPLLACSEGTFEIQFYDGYDYQTKFHDIFPVKDSPILGRISLLAGSPCGELGLYSDFDKPGIQLGGYTSSLVYWEIEKTAAE